MALSPLATLTETATGQLLVALVTLFVFVFVGRLLLRLAWRLLSVAVLVVGALYVFVVVL
ncbi:MULTISPECIES: hypothetical protein [Halorussus]|uniref:hypothetical protein n=1 Tax=Halorussus TaxID=1070314 RepID=UPI00209F0679|nr:hypothetical protein [Halorussus vallis]USZ76971.1 hypothetical protein NGM07_06480 [Halorussus vallis]